MRDILHQSGESGKKTRRKTNVKNDPETALPIGTELGFHFSKSEEGENSAEGNELNVAANESLEQNESLDHDDLHAMKLNEI